MKLKEVINVNWNSFNATTAHSSFYENSVRRLTYSDMPNMEIKDFKLPNTEMYVYGEDEKGFIFSYWVNKRQGKRQGDTSSQGPESINSWAKGRVGSDDGNGYGRYKHPLLMVLTLYNGYLSMARKNLDQKQKHREKMLDLNATKI